MARLRGLVLAIATACVACGSSPAEVPGDDAGNGGSGSGSGSGSSGGGSSSSGGTSSGSSGTGSGSGSSGSSSSSSSGGSSSSSSSSGGASSSGSSGAGSTSSSGSGSGSATDGGSRDASSGAPDAAARDAGAARDATAGEAGALPKITLWLAGDSTMADVSPATPTFFGWGQQFAQYFDANVTVKNLAIGGRSIAFWMFQVQRDATGAYLCTDTTGDPQYVLDATGNRVPTSQWASVMSGIVPGDYLFIQFGTNDATTVCPRHVSIADYQTDLGIVAAAVKAKGATAVFLTPVSQLSCGTGTPVATLTDYAAAAKTAATTYGASLLDLNTLSVHYYQSLGCTATTADVFAAGQATHFTMPGAVQIAGIVAHALGPLGLPLASRVVQ